MYTNDECTQEKHNKVSEFSNPCAREYSKDKLLVDRAHVLFAFI